MRYRTRSIFGLLLVLAVCLVFLYQGGMQIWATCQYRSAQESLARRDFANARIALRHCVGVRPHDAALRLLAAQSARRDGDLGEARTHLRAFRQLKGSAEAASLEQDLCKLQEGDMGNAKAYLEGCFANTEAVETFLILEATIEACLYALQPSPRSALAGNGSKAMDSLPPALEVRRAIELWLALYHNEEDQVQGVVWRGRLHAMLSAYALAVADLRSAVERSPRNFQGRLSLAVLLVRSDPAEAMIHLEELHRAYPANKEVALLNAGLCRTLGRLIEAREILDAILADYPNDASILLESGKLALDAQQPAEAEQLLRRAESCAPDLLEINQQLSRCLRLLGRLEEAEDYQQRFGKQNLERLRVRDEYFARVQRDLRQSQR